MRFIACGVSVIGPRHLDLQESNQDAMVLAGCRGGWIAAVADGLGSRSCSDLGAHRACQISRRILRAVPNNFDLSATVPVIHQHWLDAIEPTKPKDAATTLLLARVTAEGALHAAQLGDGLLLVRCADQFRCVTPERTTYGNQTWALEATHVQDKWSLATGRLSKPGDGVVLMTDGVADDVEAKQLADFFDALYQNLSKLNRRKGRRWLKSELDDWATPMHNDDKTLVAIFRTAL